MTEWGLSSYLNSQQFVKVDIFLEDFLVESLRSLYFHLSSSPPFHFLNGEFYLETNAGTKDYTPNAIQNILKVPLNAARILFQIRSFINRPSESSLLSIIQESLQKYLISPFYERLEESKTDRILDFIFQMRRPFIQIENVLPVIVSSNCIEQVFKAAENGSRIMMKIAEHCLAFYYEQCSLVLNGHKLLLSNDFFIDFSSNNVTLCEIPSFIPTNLAHSVFQVAKAHQMRYMGTELYNNRAEHAYELLTESENKYLSFDIYLPTSEQYHRHNSIEISSFRSAAWSIIPKTIKTSSVETKTGFDNVQKAINEILVFPIQQKADDLQKEYVEFLLKNKRLKEVFNAVSKLYLLQRGDLHEQAMDLGHVKAERLFKKNIIRFPGFDYRFMEDGTIRIGIDEHIQRIINRESINIYQNYYELAFAIFRFRHYWSRLPHNKELVGLRLSVFRFISVLDQVLHSSVDSGYLTLLNELESSTTIDEMIKYHNRFTKILEMGSLSSIPQMKQRLLVFLKNGTRFCQNSYYGSPNNVENMFQEFVSIQSFTIGILESFSLTHPDDVASLLFQTLV